MAADPGAVIVCAQNGVDNERQALRRFAAVYGMCVIMPAGYLEPGRISLGATPVPGILDLGCLPLGVDDVDAAIAADLERAGFASAPHPAIMRRKYRKLLGNLANVIDAAIGRGAEGAVELIGRAVAEAEAVLSAAGVDVGSEDEDRERRRLLHLARPGGEQRSGSSSWQSLARGTGSLETPWLNGEITLLARLHGLDAPVNEALVALGARVLRDGLAPRSVPVAEVLATIDAGRGQ